MDSKNPSAGGSRAGNVALVATIALTAFWSTSAYSRAQIDADCDEVRQQLRKLDAPAQPLQISKVDHVMLGAEIKAAETVELDPATRDSATPQLYLPPRIASRLRDIFDEAETSNTTAGDVPASPVAETEEIREVTTSSDEVATDSAAEEEMDSPLLERQMYRTDI